MLRMTINNDKTTDIIRIEFIKKLPIWGALLLSILHALLIFSIIVLFFIVLKEKIGNKNNNIKDTKSETLNDSNQNLVHHTFGDQNELSNNNITKPPLIDYENNNNSNKN